MPGMSPQLTRAAFCALVAALAVFYVVGGTTHGARVNLSKARGDQSGYLWDAERVYANWHGQTPAYLIGARNRMPLYAGFLALVYRPSMSDPQFFEVGRVANVYLSVALLAFLAVVLVRNLPRHAALNLVGVAAFGYFIFKAGYTQSELLFYTLFFVAFLAIWTLLGREPGPGMLGLAILAGALCGLAHLTKASVPPLVGLTVVTGAAWTLLAPSLGRQPRLWRLASIVALTVTFVIVLWPYLATNKRVFGHYFYNVNSTFYVWYDDWAHASVGTALHGDSDGWPAMPPEDIPTASRYLREHSLGQIAARVAGGFADMGTVLRRDYDLLPYLAIYLGGLAFFAGTRSSAMRAQIQARAWQLGFFALYLVTYLLATAFYHPISGTGTGRFLLAHVLPTLFVVSVLISGVGREGDPRSDFRGDAGSDARNDMRGAAASANMRRSFDWLVTTMLLFNVVVRVWPRLMTTYGGF